MPGHLNYLVCHQLNTFEILGRRIHNRLQALNITSRMATNIKEDNRLHNRMHGQEVLCIHQCSLDNDQKSIPSAYIYSLYHWRFDSFYLIFGVSLNIVPCIVCYEKNNQNSSFCAFNPFMLNGISHHYQLHEFISNIRVVG